ncbi:MAG: DUF72 domain-containing protein [Pseudomonadales bacterium]|nr:DUF72 domain-containing protein [Pseudomonadales bacterium]
MLYYLGLPLWSHKAWRGNFIPAATGSSDALGQYASVFNSVEGNTSFYAMPSVANIDLWQQQSPGGFRFVFKFPRLISHDAQLKHSQNQCTAFLKRIQPLKAKLGPLMLQLPASFGPESLNDLEVFIRQLSMEYQYAVEVRHGAFFSGGDAQQDLTALLAKYRIDKVVFDSRGLFSSTSQDAATLEAKQKKPSLPLDLQVTGNNPIIRFIAHENLQANNLIFDALADQIIAWGRQGKTPYLFAHLADNSQVHLLAKHLHQRLQLKAPSIKDLPTWPVERECESGQIGLF